MGKFDWPDGSGNAQFLSGDENIKEAANAIPYSLNESERRLDSKAYLVMRTRYHPELDMSPVFNDNQEIFY